MTTTTSVYWLHVLPDLTELRFDHPPDLPCHCVTIKGGYEHVTNTVVDQDKDGGPRPRPHGDDWEFYKLENLGHSATFRRKVLRMK